MFFSLNDKHKIKIEDVSEYFKSTNRDGVGNILNNTFVIVMNNGRIHTLYNEQVIRSFCAAVNINYDEFYLGINLPDRNLQAAATRTSSMDYDPTIS